MKFEEKTKAIKLRKEGLSLSDIAKKLGVSKASISYWVRDIELDDKAKKILFQKSFSRIAIEKRRKSRIKNEQSKRDKISIEAEKEFDHISERELKIIGLMIYYAEGGKTKRGLVRVANADPAIIKIMMRFFREVFLVPESKFRIHIHTHSPLNVEKAERFWSAITSIPRSQFFKTYSIPSVSSKNRRDTLPNGTCDVYVCDTKLFLRIMGMIKKISRLVVGD